MKDKTRAYQSILVIVAGFSIISIYIDYEELLYAAIALNILALLSSWFTIKVDELWYGLAHIMGKVVTPIVLSIVYFTILLPFAILSKSKTRKNLKLSKSKGSTFVKIDRQYKKDDLEQLW